MLQVVKVKPLPGYRLWLEYSDGVRGEVDLSDKISHDYYKSWQEEGVFEKVYLACEDFIDWNDDVFVRARTPYMRITGKSRDELTAEFEGAVTSQTVRPVKVEALRKYRIWIEYNDGVSGEVDLSDMAGEGRYKAWDEPGFFEKAHIGYDDMLLWNDGLGVSPGDLYMEITGKSYNELPAELQAQVLPPGDCWQLEVVKVKSLPEYRIWVEFNDGVSGELDLSEYANMPVFKVWDEPGHFEKVRVTSYGTVAWDDDLEFCTESMYMDITGKSWEELPRQVASSDTSQLVHSA